MADFSIQSCGRRCVKTDREFAPGESYFSVVRRDSGGELIREDFAADAWEGASDDCVAWWSAELPKLNEDRVYWAPNEALRAYFDEIREANQRPELVYVMALVMVRRRILKLEDHTDSATVLRLFSGRKSDRIDVSVVELSPEQIHEIEQELGRHLFTHCSSDHPSQTNDDEQSTDD